MIQGGTTSAELLAACEAVLQNAGVDSPRLSAQILAAHVLGIPRHTLVLDRSMGVGRHEAETIEALVARRAKGEPVAYLIGTREFYGLDFEVAPGVLIPRPETEHLIEEAVGCFAPDAPLLFADFGTGSGCIAVTLAKQFARARGVALDLSEDALSVARRNAVAHGVEGRVSVVRGSFSSPPLFEGKLDLVVSNPPYVSEAEYAEVTHEVKDFEPRSALVPAVEGASDGLECYRALVPAAAGVLRSGGSLILEIGWLQGGAVHSIVKASGKFEVVRVLPDLAGRDRVVVGRRI